MRARNFFTALLAIHAMCALFPGRAQAQAWLPPQGEAAFSIGYGNVFVKDHYFGSASVDDGHMRSNTLGLGLGYAVTNHLNVDVGIPYIWSKYMGDDPHVLDDGSTVDDGSYHPAFQDFRMAVRWQAVTGRVVFTPYVGGVVPSHGYVYFAHSAVGRDLHALDVGFFAARRLDPWLDKGFVQVRYSYSFVEKVIGISHNVSSADLTLGYFPTSAFGVRGLLSYGYTYGGINIPADLHRLAGILPDDQFEQVWEHHDQITHDIWLNTGVSFDYALTGSTDVTMSYFTSLYGENGHKINQGLSFGFGYSFSPAQIYRRHFAKSSHVS